MASFTVNKKATPSKEFIPAKVEQYVAKEDFAFPYNAELLRFKAGDIIPTQYMVSLLLKEGAPIAPSEEMGELMVCPHCNKAFYPSLK